MACGDTTNLKWNILLAMQRFCMARNSVEATSIAKCFQTAGFQIVVENQEGETSEANMHTEDEWNQVAKNLGSDATFEDFVDVDSAAVTSSSSTDDKEMCDGAEQDEEIQEN
ncbi:hypothetical protein PR048_009192 [Dryococelus australis]|uniref:Uncharacterized protein n=1 Tax=Dryococelus australis TaxID=614101 RepID=A0ABQ9HZ82_9NEOP|nr:hypothetical protein PR048_009192 [Dryococelus australis]